MAIDGIPLKERDIELRSLSSAIVAAIEKYIDEGLAQHWSIIIPDVDPIFLKGKSDTRTSIRDKPREIIMVLERGPITLISRKFKPDVCHECGFGKVD